MTTALLVQRYLSEYGRRPVNLVLLAVVPVVFVTLAAGAIADFAAVVGGVDGPTALSAPTAGWSAAFLAGVAGFFLVLGSRAPDRRLALAGMGAGRIAAARLATGAILAFVSAAGALVALSMRTGLGDPLRTVSGTAIFALVYLAIGVAVGSLVSNPVNGSLIVVFIWMLDVFLGPAMAGGDVWVTRLFPTHFATLSIIDSASGHAGPLGDLGLALLWTAALWVLALWVFLQGTRVSHVRWIGHIPIPLRRAAAAFRYGFRDYRRNPAMWVLLLLLPLFFISLSFYITPDEPTFVTLVENGVSASAVVSMVDVHGAIMVPITVAFLVGLAGLFVVQSSIEGDRRLSLAGFRSHEILSARFGVVGLAGLLAVGASLAVTAFDFEPEQWPAFAVANLLVAATYGLIGVVVGSLFGQLGGLYVMFLVPFVDVGIAQNVMFSASPPDWGRLLPSHGAVKLMVDAAFTPTIDGIGAAALAAAWLVGIAFVAGAVFNHIAATRI